MKYWISAQVYRGGDISTQRKVIDIHPLIYERQEKEKCDYFYTFNLIDWKEVPEEIAKELLNE